MVLAHRDVGRELEGALERAGVGGVKLRYGRSMGWWDPVGWRAVRGALRESGATHVHAWGISGVVAASVETGFEGARVGSVAGPVSPRAVKLMRVCAERVARGGRGAARGWMWTGASSSIVRVLDRGGLGGNGGGGTEALRHGSTELAEVKGTEGEAGKGIEALGHEGTEGAGRRVVRIRPGIALGRAAGEGGAHRATLRKKLGLRANDGPVILLGGDERRAARHDYGLWAAAIVQQMYPQTKVIVRAADGRAARGGTGAGVRDFAGVLPAQEMVVYAPPTVEMPWSKLVRAADILLVTAEGAMETGSILWAMAAGVPVIGTPVECVAELVEHRDTGLLAKEIKPRAIAARLEEFLRRG